MLRRDSMAEEKSAFVSAPFVGVTVFQWFLQSGKEQKQGHMVRNPSTLGGLRIIVCSD